MIVVRRVISCGCKVVINVLYHTKYWFPFVPSHVEVVYIGNIVIAISSVKSVTSYCFYLLSESY